MEVFDDKDDVSRNIDDEADEGWQFIQVESVNGSNEDELRAGRSMQGHRKGELCRFSNGNSPDVVDLAS